ncbi:katanin p60 subunit A-like 2 [Fimicolochytrium jonesii]|uniref:katanin p60 subunit A-like 2 n=1 Tax=Fimicolochytrium jonesii TaxID=1396493 RepID=UPI0022FE5547|nr:katanin p60 subunit A-like 2 [Fimicolochytrium jonesii]KAI8815763.1 katanin p60 subunit A-like 2 [Fimicolochytrium jonesii]
MSGSPDPSTQSRLQASAQKLKPLPIAQDPHRTMMQGSDMSLTRIKAASEARLAEETRTQQRQRNLMVLILDHLEVHGYMETVEKLQAESNVSLRKVQVADNVDLLHVLQVPLRFAIEYENYYNIKFGKPPKLTRSAAGKDEGTAKPKRRTPRSQPDLTRTDDTPVEQYHPSLAKVTRGPRAAISRAVEGDGGGRAKAKRPTSAGRKEDAEGGGEGWSGIVGTKVSEKPVAVALDEPPNPTPEMPTHPRLLKPLPHLYTHPDLSALAATISRDIFTTNPSIPFTAIAGLARSKRLLKEAVVYPLKFPQLFSGILTPWKGILLYGPPGTGKTMLAKAVATECETTFFNVSASSIVSKWRGDSEKLVRVLFELARYHAPSTIFLDELESIMSHRTSDGAEHEGSRRMKTELLIQMDGLSKTNEHVFLLAASNLPWDLDMAMLRRLEKRILIDVPDAPARTAMFRNNLPACASEAAVSAPGADAFSASLPVGKLDYDRLAALTEGYSGSDIKLVCKEAAMRPIRKFFDALDAMDGDLGGGIDREAADAGGLQRDPVEQADVEAAIGSTRPSSNQALGDKYREWQESFGSA